MIEKTSGQSFFSSPSFPSCTWERTCVPRRSHAKRVTKACPQSGVLKSDMRLRKRAICDCLRLLQEQFVRLGLFPLCMMGRYENELDA